MEFSRCIHIMRVRENDRGRGGNSKMQGAVGSVENRAPRKKPILSLSDLFLPRPVRPRSRHHELTITRYPIFAPKPRAPSLRSSRADSRKRSFIQSEQPTRLYRCVHLFSSPRRLENLRGSILAHRVYPPVDREGNSWTRAELRGNHLEFFRVSAIG